MGIFASMFSSKGKKKPTGSVAVLNLVSGFKDILVDLANNLADNDNEILDARSEVLAAQMKENRLIDIGNTGDSFLKGLEKLL